MSNFAQTLLDGMEEKKRKVMMAMDSIAIDIVNFVKEQGPWTDRTSNLRNSVQYKPTEELGDGTLRTVIYAGVEYAVYVEYRQGYWVLGGAMEEFRPIFTELIKQRVSAI